MKTTWYYIHLINTNTGSEVKEYGDCFSGKKEARDYGRKMLREAKENNEDFTHYKIVYEKECDGCE